jgi:hypothetical protein
MSSTSTSCSASSTDAVVRSGLLAGSLALALLAAGCGGGDGFGERGTRVDETLVEGMQIAEVEKAPAPQGGMALDVIGPAHPQSPQMRVFVWHSWADANRSLTGEAVSTARPVGYCRQVGARRMCVVGDRITAEGRPGTTTPAIVRRFATRYCWGWDKAASRTRCAAWFARRSTS